MNSTLEQPEVRAYLNKLQRLLARSPDREAVLDDITLHIETAAAQDPSNPELLRQILDELGDPALIATGATPTPTHRTPRSMPSYSGATVVVLLLTVGGLAVPAFGWGIAGSPLFAILWLIGFAMLWITKGWTAADKTIGAFTIPVILAVALFVEKLALRTDPTAAIDFAILASYAVLTAAVSIYLLVRFRPLPH